VEKNGFMPDQVKRVAARLQADVPERDRFTVLIPWMKVRTAFTAPGRYIYFSRGLIERCPDDETVAFVIAHEMAHHQLGHLNHFRGPFTRKAKQLGAGQVMVLFFRMLQKRVYSPEWECAADRRALEICKAAGYDLKRCMQLFHILETILLDAGDLDGVYGPDPESDEELFPEADFMTRAKIWVWLRKRGYLPLQDRVAVLRLHLNTLITTQ
jgi:predicted Zn-dependent protease